MGGRASAHSPLIFPSFPRRCLRRLLDRRALCICDPSPARFLCAYRNKLRNATGVWCLLFQCAVSFCNFLMSNIGFGGLHRGRYISVPLYTDQNSPFRKKTPPLPTFASLFFSSNTQEFSHSVNEVFCALMWNIFADPTIDPVFFCLFSLFFCLFLGFFY